MRSEKGTRIYSDPVAVGDRVKISIVDEESGVLEELMPRDTKLSRRHPHKHRRLEQLIVANASQMVVVASTHRPKLNFRFLDRFIVLAEAGGLKSVICLNKMDLVDKVEREHLGKIFKTYAELGYLVLFTSLKESASIDRLREILRDKFSVIVGASGVGKSTLLNLVEPRLELSIGEVSDKSGKGKHTTTAVELFDLAIGGKVADTPGVREVGLWGVDWENLDDYFLEMAVLKGSCKFNNCAHLSEPNCVVKSAVEAGKMQKFRYDSYRTLLMENFPVSKLDRHAFNSQ